MQRADTALRKTFLAIGALVVWFALISQFYLAIANRTSSIVEAVIRYFSFFTILANGLVGVALWALLVEPKSAWGRWFGRASTLTALAVYITVVGLIYNLILRQLWNPQGLQQLVDELLHSVIPTLFVLFWLLFVPQERMRWVSILSWMVFPLCYCVYCLGRGVMVGYYPYPFLDVTVLGYHNVLLNIGGLIALFFGLALVFVGIIKLQAPRLRK
jgi:hypothetical protein